MLTKKKTRNDEILTMYVLKKKKNRRPVIQKLTKKKKCDSTPAVASAAR